MENFNFRNVRQRPKQICRERFRKCRNLYRRDLFGHFGCVNAVEFSHDGRWLVSGGDDRRVLLWNINKTIRKKFTTPYQMKTEHLSNIFCTVFDNETKFIFSAGNDEDVIRHDINREEAVGHYSHEEAVYCVALPSDSSQLFATAGECGAVFIWDVRAPDEERVCLAMSSGSFHGVAFNPLETSVVVTANAHDGVTLYDLRHPEKPLMNYGPTGQKESAMFAKFDQIGTRILALMRRSGPVLYDIKEEKRLVEFEHPDYKNVCTLKSPCFIGDADQFIATGSDDFNIYVWENPGNDLEGAKSDEPIMVLKGHRSIVNQIRYNNHTQTIASSGVEKVIKLWSQFKMEACTGYVAEEDNAVTRQFYSHEEYMQLIVESGEPLSHDYGMRSVDEDPRMIAFFDSLIQRVNAGWFSDESSDDESPMDEILLQLASEAAEDEDSRSGPSVLDLLRIFRTNRIRISDESEQAEESEIPNFISRRLRRLFADDAISMNEEAASESNSDSENVVTADGRLQPESDESIRRLFKHKADADIDNSVNRDTVQDGNSNVLDVNVKRKTELNEDGSESPPVACGAAKVLCSFSEAGPSKAINQAWPSTECSTCTEVRPPVVTEESLQESRMSVQRDERHFEPRAKCDSCDLLIDINVPNLSKARQFQLENCKCKVRLKSNGNLSSDNRGPMSESQTSNFSDENSLADSCQNNKSNGYSCDTIRGNLSAHGIDLIEFRGDKEIEEIKDSKTATSDYSRNQVIINDNATPIDIDKNLTMVGAKVRQKYNNDSDCGPLASKKIARPLQDLDSEKEPSDVSNNCDLNLNFTSRPNDDEIASPLEHEDLRRRDGCQRRKYRKRNER